MIRRYRRRNANFRNLEIVPTGEAIVTHDKVDFSSVAWGSVEWTNLVTLYLRAYESRRPRPILGDHAAAAAVDRIDYDFKRIHRSSLPVSNQYLVVLRAKQLDEWCADFLRRHPEAVVLHLGCGLDGRAFRISVPTSVQWFDLDQPGVIELRRRLYEDTAHYHMIGSSVTDPRWLADIPRGRPALIVAEGLLMYLEPTDALGLITECARRFPGGRMMFDLPPSWFAALARRGGFRTSLRYRVPAMPFGMSVSEAATLVDVIPGVRAVHDVPYPRGRGHLVNSLMWTAQRIPLLDPLRPSLTLLEFG